MTRTRKTGSAILGALLLIALLFSLASAQAGGPRQFADWLIAQRLTVNNAAIFNSAITANDDLAIAGNVDIAGTTILRDNASAEGTFTINGSDLVVAETLAIAPQTAISLTNGGVLTPTGTVQPVTAAGNVTVTLAAGSNGDMLRIINTADLTVLIEDTSGQALASNASLGQWDTLDLVYILPNWIEIGRSNN